MDTVIDILDKGGVRHLTTQQAQPAERAQQRRARRPHRLRRDGTVRDGAACVVISGAGERAFCAGADLDEIDATRLGRGARVHPARAACDERRRRLPGSRDRRGGRVRAGRRLRTGACLPPRGRLGPQPLRAAGGEDRVHAGIRWDATVADRRWSGGCVPSPAHRRTRRRAARLGDRAAVRATCRRCRADRARRGIGEPVGRRKQDRDEEHPGGRTAGRPACRARARGRAGRVGDRLGGRPGRHPRVRRAPARRHSEGTEFDAADGRRRGAPRGRRVGTARARHRRHDRARGGPHRPGGTFPLEGTPGPGRRGPRLPADPSGARRSGCRHEGLRVRTRSGGGRLRVDLDRLHDPAALRAPHRAERTPRPAGAVDTPRSAPPRRWAPSRSPSRRQARTWPRCARPPAWTATATGSTASKIFISNGDVADVIVLFATVDPALGQAGHHGLPRRRRTGWRALPRASRCTSSGRRAPPRWR